MEAYSIWVLESQDITVSGGKSLSGLDQGDGTHLIGETVTFETRNWREIDFIDDERDFDDNDDNQLLRGDQTINGTFYPDGTVVEAEYVVVLLDPSTDIEYTAVTVNVRDSDPDYATVEAIAIIGDGGFPPDDVAFEVVSVDEGPGSFNRTEYDESEFTFPICFTPGTLIATPHGPRAVESLAQGDTVLTRDNGEHAVLWVGHSTYTASDVQARPAFRPVRLEAGALGNGVPTADLVVSQPHHVLLTGWKAELLFGQSEVLVAARHLIGRPGISLDEAPNGISYLHLMLDGHEIVTANGAPAETFFPGPAAMHTLSPEARADLMQNLGSGQSRARQTLKAWEAAALVA